MFDSVLNTSVSITTQLSSNYWDTFITLAYSAPCFFQVLANISNHIQCYKGIFTHIETFVRHIQAYSAPYVTLTYSQPCHILSPGIIRTGGLKLCETLTRHIQNLVQHLHEQKPGILGILEYSKLFHNYIPTYIQNPVIFTKKYEYSDIFKTRHIFRTLSKI